MEELEEKDSKNAIIIVGNGFDLAHGMKTSYSDFSDWYIENKILPIFDDFPLKKENFNPKFIKYCNDKFLYEGLLQDYDSNVKWLRGLFNSSFEEEELENFKERFIIDKTKFKYVIKNQLLGKLYQDKYDNWFDIEQAYFHELVKLMGEFNAGRTLDSTRKLLNILNNDFLEIQNSLEEYLLDIKVVESDSVGKFFMSNFYGKKKVTIVNFNYTDTISSYVNRISLDIGSKINTKEVVVNHIHGKLSDRIIFGYGDDGNKDYLLMKESGIDEFLKNFKTFHYIQDYNYRKIIDELSSSKDYEVYILGHSLGATDKTLLSEIMDSDKCINIHLFKRNDLLDENEKQTELQKLVFNLSRILKHDKDSRKKIVPIELCSHFPYNYESDLQIIDSKFKEIYGPDFGKPKRKNGIKASFIPNR